MVFQTKMNTTYLITIRRQEFSDNIGRKTHTATFQGDYADAVTYAKSLLVYKDEWFSIEPFSPYIPSI